ncbi:2,3-bisphosphoglycerate-independent phosphoglycerate mutase [Chloroflexota bacterium]
MFSMELIKEIAHRSPTKIILVVIDGLGGLPNPETGRTELETAYTPNLDQLATQGICGLIDPVGVGITPGSGPGHLALFGYNPFQYIIGRGILEALGIDFDLQLGDVAARGNFCTVDKDGVITDRRAGRISTERCIELCQLLDDLVIEDVKLFIRPIREHRFSVVFRGNGLVTSVSDSDPQQTGVTPETVIALSPEASRMTSIANQFIAQTKAILSEYYPSNMLLLRGFSQRTYFPSMAEVYRLQPAAIASYPMYRGLAKLLGIDILATGMSVDDELQTLKQNYADYDYFFLHIKGTDIAGEDGDFDRKTRIIADIDRSLTDIMSLQSVVVVVTGDHSTPAILGGHSWHPVPVLLYSKWCRPDKVSEFSETACLSGGLGRLYATQIMPLAMANAFKLNKYGA